MEQQNDISNVLNDQKVLVEGDEGYEEQQIQALEKALENAKTLEDVFKITDFGNYKGTISALTKEKLDNGISTEEYVPLVNLKTLTGFSYEDKVRVAVYCCAIVQSVLYKLQEVKNVKFDDLKALLNKNKTKSKKLTLKLGEVNKPAKGLFSYSVVSDFLTSYQANSGVSFNYSVDSNFLYKMFSDGVLTVEENDGYKVAFNSSSCDFSFIAVEFEKIFGIFNDLTLSAIRNYSLKSLKDGLVKFLNEYKFSFCGLNADDIFNNYKKNELSFLDGLDEVELFKAKRSVVAGIMNNFSKRIYADPYHVKFNNEFDIDGKTVFVTDFNFESKNIKKASKKVDSSNLNSKGSSNNILYYIAKQMSGVDFSRFNESFEIQSSGFVKKFNADWKLSLKPIVDEGAIEKLKDALDEIQGAIDERLNKLKYLYGKDVPMKSEGTSDDQVVDTEKLMDVLSSAMGDINEGKEFTKSGDDSGYFFRVTLKRFNSLKKDKADSIKSLKKNYTDHVQKLKDLYPDYGKDEKEKQRNIENFKKGIIKLNTEKDKTLLEIGQIYNKSFDALLQKTGETVNAINDLASAIANSQRKLIKEKGLMASLGKAGFSEEVCNEWKNSFLLLMSDEQNIVQKRLPEPKQETDKSYRLNGDLSFKYKGKDYSYNMNLLIVVR